MSGILKPQSFIVVFLGKQYFDSAIYYLHSSVLHCIHFSYLSSGSFTIHLIVVGRGIDAYMHCCITCEFGLARSGDATFWVVLGC